MVFMQQALDFLKNHVEIAFATCEGNLHIYASSKLLLSVLADSNKNAPLHHAVEHLNLYNQYLIVQEP